MLIVVLLCFILLSVVLLSVIRVYVVKQPVVILCVNIHISVNLLVLNVTMVSVNG